MASDRFTFASFNIRYDPSGAVPLGETRLNRTQIGKKPVPGGERPWSERRTSLANQVLWEAPDCVGFQV